MKSQEKQTVNQERFDPFSFRLARDIRNTLSKAFLQSLNQHDPVIFQKNADDILRQKLAPQYQNYIKDRLARYDKALAIIIKQDISEVVEQSEVLWNLQLFYEMHEILEGIWIKSDGARRKALQGLIRAAGMKIHADQGRHNAAKSMAEKSLTDLMEYRSALPEFPQIDSVLEEARKIAAISSEE
jgi:hypothetical protein